MKKHIMLALLTVVSSTTLANDIENDTKADECYYAYQSSSAYQSSKNVSAHFAMGSYTHCELEADLSYIYPEGSGDIYWRKNKGTYHINDVPRLVNRNGYWQVE